MNRKLISIVTAFAVITTSVAAAAQAPAAQATRSSQQSVGPTVSANTAGIRAQTSTKELNASASRDAHMGAGQNVALMVVGGAALIVGVIIGHTAGLLLAVGGAVVGLYGLYSFVQ